MPPGQSPPGEGMPQEDGGGASRTGVWASDWGCGQPRPDRAWGFHQVHLQEKDEVRRSASVFWHVEKIHTIPAVGLGMGDWYTENSGNQNMKLKGKQNSTECMCSDPAGSD